MTVTHLKGPTIRLISGAYFDLEDPAASTITIRDVAHALANLCRFTGHVHRFYSVAQHSVLVSAIVPPEDALAGLLHDMAEAVLGDVSKPLKCLLPDYQRIEQRVEAEMFRRFGLSTELPASVKYADRVLLRTEQRDLCHADGEAWQFSAGVLPLEAPIVPWPAPTARHCFLERYRDLTGEVV